MDYNVQQLIDYICVGNEAIRSLELELSSLNKTAFAYERARKLELKGKLKKLKKDVINKEHELVLATTFKRKELSSFLSSVLSVIKSESYVVTKIAKKNDKKDVSILEFSNLVIGDSFHDVDWDLIGKLKLNDFEMDINKYHIIVKEEDIKGLDFKDILVAVLDLDVIMLEKKKISLLDGIELNGRFEAFPELKDIAYRLVDLKLSNPELSDVERMQFVLNGLKNKYR